MPDFNAYTPLSGGKQANYYRRKEYPFDFDASLDFTRPATGTDFFPYPPTIGCLQGLLPTIDATEYSLMLGPVPHGPSIDLLYSQALSGAAFPDINGGMTKTKS